MYPFLKVEQMWSLKTREKQKSYECEKRKEAALVSSQRTRHGKETHAGTHPILSEFCASPPAHSESLTERQTRLRCAAELGMFKAFRATQRHKSLQVLPICCLCLLWLKGFSTLHLWKGQQLTSFSSTPFPPEMFCHVVAMTYILLRHRKEPYSGIILLARVRTAK